MIVVVFIIHQFDEDRAVLKTLKKVVFGVFYFIFKKTYYLFIYCYFDWPHFELPTPFLFLSFFSQNVRPCGRVTTITTSFRSL